ncbi:uncharacterized protein F4807DRAFT_426443 [Annulohypoxylon truncatum]|uniref:uncharacterized protein n=1 Tax=Annulohypoxylon truncatum TaxID=327061 RepID=UPI002008BCAC|nr:uncharacterized protein F4807DRAFT_426443 [Annulohypoxylon truncatum]KAI1209356.1 hypothetical protein F4807DRAFT_426443 [Annulohypoxylon truncatum]
MTSYTSQEPEHIPGSFPTDDMLSTPVEHTNLASSTPHSHHNKLHKRDDPRGWTDEGKTAHGHQHTDSSVGLTDRSGLDYDTRNIVNEKAFHSNQTPLQGHTEQGNPSSITDSQRANQHEIHRKPGVMTGAYSQLDEDNNLNHPKSNAPYSTQQQTGVARGVVGPTPGTGVLVTPEAEAKLGNDNRNMVKQSLRHSSDLEHDDPYWGDVPYGTGTYNTITGHGSSETPDMGSVHPHGSQLHHDREQSNPLSTGHITPHDELASHNSSKFKEGAATGTAAGAAAGAGLAASKLPEHQKGHHHEKADMEESSSHKNDDNSTSTGSKILSFFQWDNKEKDSRPERHEVEKEHEPKQQKPIHNDKPLTKRDAGAALAAASVASGAKDNDRKHEDSKTALYGHPDDKFDSRDVVAKDSYVTTGNTGPHTQSTSQNTNKVLPMSDNTTRRGHPSSSQVEPTEHKDSKFAYGLGAAGIGAGAGYAIHEHANKDNNPNRHSTQPAYENTMVPPPKASTQPMHSSHIDDRAQHSMVAGTAASIASSGQRQTMPQTNPSAQSSHTDPSHQPQYFILPDGTPSGMNIGDHSGAQTHLGEQRNTTTGTSSVARDVAAKGDHTGAKLAAAGAGVAGAGTAAHHANKQSHGKNTTTGSRKAMDLDSNNVHEPYMQAAGAQSHIPTATSHHGEQQHILRDTMRPSNTARDQHADNNLAVSSPGAPGTIKDGNRTGAKGTAAAAAGVAGAGAAAHHHNSKNVSDNNAAPSSTTREQRSATTSSHAPHSASSTTKSHARNRASTDSSHDGQYNVLSSGTPSGINREHLGHEHGSSDSGEGLGGFETGRNAVHPPAMETGAGIGAATKEKETGTGLRRTGMAAGAGAGAGAGTGMAAAAASALKAGDRVVHRCGKCGEENDITGYFRE